MSYTTLVAVFMIIVVKLACRRRATKPVVPNDKTWFRPPARYCCRNNSTTGTLTPALDACWICATSTSMGSVNAALNTPPISDEMTCSLVVRTRSGLLRLYTMFSACTEKKKREDQSATRLTENMPEPFMSAATPSFWITLTPMRMERDMVSSGVICSRKMGSVITRVLSSSVGLSTKPWKPPPIPPAMTSAVPLPILSFLTKGGSPWEEAIPNTHDTLGVHDFLGQMQVRELWPGLLHDLDELEVVTKRELIREAYAGTHKQLHACSLGLVLVLSAECQWAVHAGAAIGAKREGVEGRDRAVLLPYDGAGHGAGERRREHREGFRASWTMVCSGLQPRVSLVQYEQSLQVSEYTASKWQILSWQKVVPSGKCMQWSSAF